MGAYDEFRAKEIINTINSGEINKIIEIGNAKFFRKDIESLPKELFDNEELALCIAEHGWEIWGYDDLGYDDYRRKDYRYINLIPDSQRNNPKVVEALFRHIDDEIDLERLVKNGIVGEELKDNKEFLNEIATNTDLVFKIATDELKKDETFVLDILRKNGMNFKNLDEEGKNNKEYAEEALKSRKDAIEYIGDELYKDDKWRSEMINKYYTYSDIPSSIYRETIMKLQDNIESEFMGTVLKDGEWIGSDNAELDNGENGFRIVIQYSEYDEDAQQYFTYTYPCHVMVPNSDFSKSYIDDDNDEKMQPILDYVKELPYQNLGDLVVALDKEEKSKDEELEELMNEDAKVDETTRLAEKVLDDLEKEQNNEISE